MKNMNIILSSVLVLLAGSIAMGEWGLEWHTVDGGGAMRSTSIHFELSGSIGQFDAGRSEGQTFSFTGGFWFEHSPGDCVLDGAVTLYDTAIFEECADGPNSPEVPLSCACMDFDGDGDVDLRDVAAFQSEFSGP